MGCHATEDIWIVSVEKYTLLYGESDPGKPTMQDKNSRADYPVQVICHEYGNGDQFHSVHRQRKFSRRNWVNFVKTKPHEC